MSYFGGAIYGLIEKQSADEFEWDVITGASAGSIYATLMGLWPKGKKAKWQSSSSLISMVSIGSSNGRRMALIVQVYIMTLLSSIAIQNWFERLNFL